MSAGKFGKGRYISILQGLSNGTIANTRQQKIPEWIFQKRDIDIDLDEILARVVGYGDPNGRDLTGKGLAAYPDDKADGYADPEWADFDDAISDLADLADNTLIEGAPYNITDDLLDTVDVLLSRNVTDDEIAMFMYTGGKLFARYDNPLLGSPKWVWHGEEAVDTPDNPATDFAFMWRVIKEYLPRINNIANPDSADPAGGENYKAMMSVLATTMAEDGLMEFLLDVPTLSADSEDLFNDIYDFLGENFVTGTGSMWVTLADLMDQLANNVESTTPEKVAEIYSDFGFQRNN